MHNQIRHIKNIHAFNVTHIRKRCLHAHITHTKGVEKKYLLFLINNAGYIKNYI